MKRILLTAMASSALALAAPAMASAHHGSHHAGARHSSSHKRHAKRAHLVRFTSSTVAGTHSGASATPATGETVGTVTSFTGGVLTLTLTDNSTVSGKVTERTEIKCGPAGGSPGESGDDDQGGGDDKSGSDAAENGAPAGSGPIGAGQRGDSMQGSRDGNQQDEGGENEEGCTVAALAPGATVREAELRVSSAGGVWEKVDLAQ
jgi:hypothetical protein